VLAGALRNAAAVADAAIALGRPVQVVAAGERNADEPPRPALEDLLGAGAIIDRLASAGDCRLSVDAAAARACYRGLAAAMPDLIARSASGMELIQAGFGSDVALACEINVSLAAPRLIDGAYRWNG
jgi:2-phosphosulfolactate phosphatase